MGKASTLNPGSALSWVAWEPLLNLSELSFPMANANNEAVELQKK